MSVDNVIHPPYTHLDEGNDRRLGDDVSEPSRRIEVGDPFLLKDENQERTSIRKQPQAAQDSGDHQQRHDRKDCCAQDEAAFG
jgi:hypothetical protein